MEELFENNNNYHIEMNQIYFPPKKKLENKKGTIDLNKSKEEPESKDSILENKKIKNNKTKKSKKGKIKSLTKERIKEILAYIDVELNDLGYNKAFKLDHRTYFQFYFSLIKTKHIFFQLFDKKDYNTLSIKILLLFFNFGANYAVNALFFNDETMHQISEDGGDFNII